MKLVTGVGLKCAGGGSLSLCAAHAAEGARPCVVLGIIDGATGAHCSVELPVADLARFIQEALGRCDEIDV